MSSLALIGYGEVASTLSRGLLGNSGVRIAVYDTVFDDAHRGAHRIAAAEAAGVRVAANAAEASRGASIVISAVTAAAAAQVAGDAAAYLRPGQIFFDVNSASPRTKRLSAQRVEAAGARFVEGAVMAAVAGPGLKVPILAGGPAAEALAETLNALGMNITAVTTEPGRASAMKLCRSIVMKGLEALMIECVAAARQWDVEKEVLASLRETYPSIDWQERAATMAKRVAQHGVRRAAEMREAAQMLEDLGADPALCLAIADVQQRHAKP